jgi:hypothetical protein
MEWSNVHCHMPNGSANAQFLHDGDTVIHERLCTAEKDGVRIGFGECAGKDSSIPK